MTLFRFWSAGPGSMAALAMALGLAIGILVPRGVPAVEPEGRISVLGEVAVDAEIVRLEDIARLEGPAASMLGTIEISRAPAPGGVRTLSGGAILGTLRERGVNLEQIRYVIPPVVRVRRRAQEIAVSTIRGLVEDYFATQPTVRTGRLVLRSIEVPRSVRVPLGPYRSRVTPTRGAPLAGKTPLLVEFLRDDRVVATIGVTATTAVFEDVHVTRRRIARGQVLTAEDVAVERRDVSTLPRDVVTRMEDLAGKEATVVLAPLSVVRHEQLATPALVRRGQVVTLLAESGALLITTKGEVREDAPRGAQVRVLNRTSQKEVVGRVVDGRTVAVGF